MDQKQINTIIKLLKEKGVFFEKGLSNEEIEKVENRFDVLIPQDLKLLLQTQLPVNDEFVHWRYGINSEKGGKEIDSRFEAVWEGIIFDIQYNSFWLEEWGLKPKSIAAQIEMAKADFINKPQLIPIYSHRYIPSLPNEIGNPVFSVYQTDIIYYGYDLADYLANEFKIDLPDSFGKIEIPKKIDFWTDLAE